MMWRTILVAAAETATLHCVRRVAAETQEVQHAASGEAALGALAQGPPSLLVLAQSLVPVRSLELLTALRAAWPALPVLFLVEHFDSTLVRAAFRAGASDVLQTPLLEMEFRDSLRRLAEDFATVPPCTFHRAAARTRKFSFSLNPNLAARPLAALQAPPTTPFAETPLPLVPVRLRASCFGKFQVFVNERAVAHWACHKSKLLFADLLLNHKQWPAREILMETFWPNAESDSARNSLNVALHHIRRALHHVLPQFEFIVFREECYYLHPDLEIELDVETFMQHSHKAQIFTRAQNREAALAEYERMQELYRGDFMEDELYDSWAASQREHFKEVFLFALDHMSDTYRCFGNYEDAARLCEQILLRDNCREDIHRRLMFCYDRLDKRDKAMKQFHKCEKILKEELEIKPSRATLELYEKIKQGEAP